VVHTINVDDMVLNVGQMRDAAHVQNFCPPVQPLNSDLIVHETCARQSDIQKAARAKESGGPVSIAGRARGQGRGRGEVRGQGRGRGRGQVTPIAGSLLRQDV